MGAPLIGRTACPECGFGAAHVKRSERCVYRYCPECGAMYHATGKDREAALLAKTRLLDAPPTPTGPSPTPAPEPDAGEPAPTPSPTPSPAPTPAKKKAAGLFTF